MHAPVPLQSGAAVAFAFSQVAVPHDVVAPGYEQTAMLTPSHVPAQELPSLAQAVLPPTGAPVTGAHVPAEPGKLHAPHCSVHAVEQQTPSTQ